MPTFRARAASAALAFSAALHLTAATPGPQQALGTARQQLAAHDCRAAVHTLQTAMPEATAIAVEKERGDALSALHFYSAVAQTDCGAKDKARDHLRQFFQLRPGQSSLDPSKYDRAFLTLFDEVQRSVHAKATPNANEDLFGRFYPGFETSGDAAEEQLPVGLWSTSAAFQILASDVEREEWGRLRDDEARAAFAESFWERRDPDPSTEQNELRSAIARRVAFADRYFGQSNELRGAMSDRGRVFVLLGMPARVHRQPLQRYQTTFVTERARTPLTGTMERWIYFKPQLFDVAAQQVEFRFITQPGYGEYVMQRDFWPLKAMGAARTPAR